MKKIAKFRQRYLTFSDLLVAILIGFFIMIACRIFDKELDIDSDTAVMSVSVMAAIAFGGYFTLIFGFYKKNQKIDRLVQSSKFKDVLFILVGYALSCFIATFILVSAKIGLEFVIAIYAMTVYRFGWLFAKTIRLL